MPPSQSGRHADGHIDSNNNNNIQDEENVISGATSGKVPNVHTQVKIRDYDVSSKDYHKETIKLT